jgi:hypothetical protein
MAFITTGAVYITFALGWVSLIYATFYEQKIQEDPPCKVQLAYRDGHANIALVGSGGTSIEVVSGKYVQHFDQVNPSDQTYPFGVYGVRFIDAAIMGMSKNGYFIFDHNQGTYYLTSQYGHWVSRLRKINISPTTRLYPGPIGCSYVKRGWLPGKPDTPKEVGK